MVTKTFPWCLFQARKLFPAFGKLEVGLVCFLAPSSSPALTNKGLFEMPFFSSSSVETTENTAAVRKKLVSHRNMTRFSVVSSDDDKTARFNEGRRVSWKSPFVGEGHQGGYSVLGFKFQWLLHISTSQKWVQKFTQDIRIDKIRLLNLFTNVYNYTIVDKCKNSVTFLWAPTHCGGRRKEMDQSGFKLWNSLKLFPTDHFSNNFSAMITGENGSIIIAAGTSNLHNKPPYFTWLRKWRERKKSALLAHTLQSSVKFHPLYKHEMHFNYIKWYLHIKIELWNN